MHSFCLGNFPWWMKSCLDLSEEGQELALLRKTCFSRADAGVWGWEEPWYWKPVSGKGKPMASANFSQEGCSSLEVSELLVDAVWMTQNLSPGGPLKLTWPFMAEAVKAENTFNKGYYAYSRWKHCLSPLHQRVSSYITSRSCNSEIFVEEWYQKTWAPDLALSLKEAQRAQTVSLLTWLTATGETGRSRITILSSFQILTFCIWVSQRTLECPWMSTCFL